MRLILDTQEKIEYYKASIAAMDDDKLLKWERTLSSCRTEEGARAADNGDADRTLTASDIDLIVQIAVVSHPYLQDEINNRGLQPL